MYRFNTNVIHNKQHFQSILQYELWLVNFGWQILKDLSWTLMLNFQFSYCFKASNNITHLLKSGLLLMLGFIQNFCLFGEVQIWTIQAKPGHLATEAWDSPRAFHFFRVKEVEHINSCLGFIILYSSVYKWRNEKFLQTSWHYWQHCNVKQSQSSLLSDYLSAIRVHKVEYLNLQWIECMHTNEQWLYLKVIRRINVAER